MRTVIKIFIIGSILLCLFTAKKVQAQYDFMYFSGQPQGQSFNPAISPDSKMYIQLPVVSNFGINFRTAGFAYQDLIHQHPVYPDSLQLDFNGFLDKIKKNNSLMTNINTNILGFGFQVKENYFYFNMSLNVESKFSFSKGLFDFIANGTDMSEQNVNLLGGRMIDATAYLTTAFGYSREVNDKLTLGGSFKIYNGIANVRSNKTELNLEFDGNNITGYGNVDINTSFVFGRFKSAGSLIDGDDDFDFESADGGDIVKNLMKNKGFGVDFGAVYKYNDDMTFSASIVDFGFIKWKTNSTAIKSKNPGERVEFSGINSTYDNIGDDIDDYFDEMEDSIKRAFDLGVEDLGSYTTMVPVKLYLGYSWQFEKNMYLNALYRGRFISGGYENSLSLNYTYKNGFFQISAGNTINHRFFNPGIYLGLGNIFYMGADYSKSVNLAKTKGLSFYFGLNIAVGKKSVKKVKTEQENTETNETSFLER